MAKRSSVSIVWRTSGCLLVDALRFLLLGLRARSRLAAENLFLRKQLALYAERRVRSRRADDATLNVYTQVIDGALRAATRSEPNCSLLFTNLLGHLS